MISLYKSVSRLAALLLCLTCTSLGEERPNTTTPCDYYSQKTVGDTSAQSQMTLMALVLHSALLGPFSKYNTVKVPNFVGALTPTTFQGEACDLRGYFNGALASANKGGDKGVAVNFFDDGGIEALKQIKPSNGNTSSAQYMFTTHVYSYFGTFLGCKNIGSKELPKYEGKASMYEVHKFMDLNKAEMGFFIDQAVSGLKSIGFTDADAQSVNKTLNGAFNQRCAPAAGVPTGAAPELQAICIASDCALSPNDTCAAYAPAVAPTVVNQQLLGNYTKAADGTTSFGATGGSGGNSGSPAKSSSGKTGAGWVGGLGIGIVAMPFAMGML